MATTDEKKDKDKEDRGDRVWTIQWESPTTLFLSMTEFVDFKMSDGDWAYRLEFTSKVDYTLSIIRPHVVQQIRPLHSKQLCVFEGPSGLKYANQVNRDCVFAVDESRFTCSHDFEEDKDEEEEEEVKEEGGEEVTRFVKFTFTQEVFVRVPPNTDPHNVRFRDEEGFTTAHVVDDHQNKVFEIDRPLQAPTISF